MTDKEKEALAFKLIDMTGWALKKLYGGTLPTSWKDRIKNACDMTTVGAAVEPEKRNRDIEIATKALAHKMAAERWKKEGRKHLSYNQFIYQLMEEYGFQDKKTFLAIIKKYQPGAALKLREAIKIYSDLSLSFSQENNEPQDQNLANLSRAIKLPRPEIDRITEWINQGFSLKLFEAETDFQEKFIAAFFSKK